MIANFVKAAMELIALGLLMIALYAMDVAS